MTVQPPGVPRSAPKRVLVTGATGFLGRAAARQLRAAGWDVTGTSGSGLEDTRRADLLDERAVRRLMEEVRPSHLLHAAWRPVHGDVMHSPENIRWVAASLLLVQAFQQSGGERAAVVGSSAEYDWTDGICRNGATPLRPGTIYGACKHALHIALAAFARQTGIGFVWPRVFFVYGPGEDERRLVASVIRALLKGVPAECTEGRQIRDYLHVDDVAAGLVAALESTYDGPIDLAAGHGVSVRELVTQVARQIGREDLLRLGARPSPSHDVPLVVGDGAEAASVLGWAPQLSLEQGLADTIAWGRSVFTQAVPSDHSNEKR